jgi:CRISPR-associated endoribonuclease Cas6
MIKTGTPIIIRIKKESSKDLHNLKKDYEYFFWRITFPIELFIKQVTSNLVKKYLEYNSISDLEKDNLDLYSNFFSFFQKFRYKKQVSNVVTMKGTSHIVISSLWEFGFEGREDKNIIKFALDCGLGERNSLGFGFLNLISKSLFIRLNYMSNSDSKIVKTS